MTHDEDVKRAASGTQDYLRECSLGGNGWMPRAHLSYNKQDAQGHYAWAFGLTFGYWPCTKGPFVTLRFAVWRIDLWLGLLGNKGDLK